MAQEFKSQSFLSEDTQLVERVARLLTHMTGVQIHPESYSMMEARLLARMRETGVATASEYLKFIEAQWDTEIPILVSLLTTHHSFFFREFSQFEFLEQKALPRILDALKPTKRQTLRVWVAACSRGQEVYSLALLLDHHLKKSAPEMSYEILGTDIDPESISLARNGVYRYAEIKSIPSIYLQGNWVRGTGKIANYVKINDNIKANCHFSVLNLHSIPDEFADQKFDLIFCRNVFIYFNKEQVRDVSARMLQTLEPHGVFFVGKSESLNGLKLPLSVLEPSVYSPVEINVLPKSVDPPPASSQKKAIRVLCVDDSPTVLSLLKKVLQKSEGFEVVATANDGLQAAEQMAKQEIDLVTLDLHMPRMNGIEYLQKYLTASHPPVVIISSVSREDSETGLRSLELGARDYIEKPALSTLEDKAEEIRTKLRCALRNKNSPAPKDIARDFKTIVELKSPEKMLRLIVAGAGDKDKLQDCLKELKGPQPPTVVLFNGPAPLMGVLGKIPQVVSVTSDSLPEPLRTRQVYLALYSEVFGKLKEKYSTKKTSILIFGGIGESMLTEILGWEAAQYIFEDQGVLSPKRRLTLGRHAALSVPATSFIFHSNHFLGRED